MKSTIAIRHPELDIEDLLELEGENFEERYNKLFNEAFWLTTTKHELIDVLWESWEKLLTSKDAYNTLYLGLIRSRVREKLQPYLYWDMSRDLLYDTTILWW